MENNKFRVAEEINNFQIPFAIDDESIIEWLQRILLLNTVESIEKLFYVIATLNKTKIPVQQRFFLIHEIENHLKEITTLIDKKCIDISFPLLKDEREILEKFVWCHLEIARSHIMVAKKSTEITTRFYAWHHAIVSMSQAYLYISACYCSPNKEFWRLCYHIYECAEKEGFLLKPITETNHENETIDKLFKQILIFSLTDPNQFRAKEMQTIFNFLGNYTSEIKIHTYIDEDRKKGIFAFDLKQDWQPIALSKLKQFKTSNSSRFISPVLIAKHIYQAIHQEKKSHGVIKTINQSLFMRLIKTLGMTQSRKSTRLSDQSNFKGIIGFNYLSSYLRKQSGEVKRAKKSNTLAILDLGEEHTHQMRTIYKEEMKTNEQMRNIFQLSAEGKADESIWSVNNNDENELIETINTTLFSLFDSSITGYALTWNNLEDRVKLGDLLGIINTDPQRLEITLIRNINRLSEDSVRLGVEIIGLESRAVFIKHKKDNSPGNWAILIPGNKALKRPDSVVFKAGKYKKGEFITIRHDKVKRQYRLSKLLNSTPAVTQAELFLIDSATM